jgi:peptidoglycan biosynthesis protein MviN/MurJ (putative lipid II flippase)
MFVLWLGHPKNWLHLTDERYAVLLRYAFAWLAGILGGTLYDAKWLYHTVARQLWHQDRRIWRLFTPHISGGLAFVVISLVASGLLRIFDRRAVESNAMVIGVGFLVGYFSDSAVAKLAEIAETLFGTNRSKEKHRDKV